MTIHCNNLLGPNRFMLHRDLLQLINLCNDTDGAIWLALLCSRDEEEAISKSRVDIAINPRDNRNESGSPIEKSG